jgi:hypothetical protein
VAKRYDSSLAAAAGCFFDFAFAGFVTSRRTGAAFAAAFFRSK